MTFSASTCRSQTCQLLCTLFSGGGYFNAACFRTIRTIIELCTTYREDVDSTCDKTQTENSSDKLHLLGNTAAIGYDGTSRHSIAIRKTTWRNFVAPVCMHPLRNTKTSFTKYFRQALFRTRRCSKDKAILQVGYRETVCNTFNAGAATQST